MLSIHKLQLKHLQSGTCHNMIDVNLGRLKTLKCTARFESLVSRFHNLDPSYLNDRLPYLTVLGFGTISFIKSDENDDDVFMCMKY